jgi:ABC-type nitrate/sulfonate/bicarbonate transport system ATPase subunit
MPDDTLAVRNLTERFVTILFVTHDIEEVSLLTDSLLRFKTIRLAEYERTGVHDMEAIYG